MLQKIKTIIYNLLKSSEKWIKTDMVYLTRGGFWLTLGQGISMSSSLILAIIFANLIPKEIYGTYRYVLSIAGILTIATLSGMNTAIIRSVARGQEKVFYRALKTKIYWGIIGSITALAISGYYFWQANIELSICLLIVSAFLPLMDSFTLYDSILQGKKNFRLSTKYAVIAQIIVSIVIVVTAILTKNVYLITFSYFSSWTLIRFILLKRSLQIYELNIKEDPEAISYGKHLSFMLVITTIANYLDRLLIFHFLGAVEVAIYSIAIAPPEQIKGLIKNLNTLALPKFSEKSLEEIKSSIWGKILKLSLLIITIIAIYLIAAPFIYKIFFPLYVEAIPLSQLFSLSLLANAMFIPLSIMQSQKMSRQLYKFNFITSIIQIGALLAIIPYFSLYAVILARVFTRFSGLILTFWQLKTTTKTTIK